MVGELVRNCGLISLVHIRKFRGRIMLLNFVPKRQNETRRWIIVLTTDRRGVRHTMPQFIYFSPALWALMTDRHDC